MKLETARQLPAAEAAQDHILANMLNMLDSAMGNLTTALTTGGKRPPFLSTSCTGDDNLPRQARDKHKLNEES